MHNSLAYRIKAAHSWNGRGRLSHLVLRLALALAALQTEAQSSAPTILIQPQSAVVPAGQIAVFAVTASGTPTPSYQWRMNGADLPGATANSLTLTGVQAGNSGNYAVVVSNPFGSVTSAVVKLTVIPAANDLIYFADFQAAPGSEWSATNTDVTPLANRRFLGQFGNQTVQLTLTNLPPHTEANVTFDLFIINSWDGSIISPSGPDIWQLSVDGGPILLHTTFCSITRPENVGARQAFPYTYPAVDFPPNTGAAEVQTLGFSWIRLKYDALYDLSFQFPHASNTLVLDFSALGLEALDNESWGLDNVVVSLASVPSNSPPSIASQPASQTLLVGRTAVFNVGATPASSLSYQWQCNGTTIPGATNQVYTRSNLQTNDNGNYSVIVTNAFGFTNSQPAVLTVTNSPPIMVVQPEGATVPAGSTVFWFASSVGSEPTFFQWRLGETNISGATGTLYRQYNAQHRDAGEYTVVASNAFGVVTSAVAILIVTPAPPVITAQPMNLVVGVGSNATFSVSSTGSEPFSYQWRFNGTNISDATTAAYTLSNAQPADVGSYSVVITNVVGSVTSSIASLGLITSQPLSQTVNAGDNAVFSVAVAGTGLQFQWQFNGTNLVGETSTTLTLSSIGTNQAGIYDVLVSLGTVSLLSEPAELIVPLPGQPGSKKWQFTHSGGGIHTTPALAKDGTIYVVANGALIALNPSGTEQWFLPLPGVIYAAPTVSPEGTIYVGASSTNLLYAVNPNGTLCWQTNVPGVLILPPSLAEDGTILIPAADYPSTNSSCVALNTNGSIRWQFYVGGRPTGAALGYDGTIHIGSYDASDFFALHPDGTTNWSFAPIYFSLQGTPAIGSDGTIYEGASHVPRFNAFRPDGAVRWEYVPTNGVAGDPAIASDGTIYFATGNGKLHALTADGTLKWVYDLGALTFTSPAVSKRGTIYISANDKRFLAINPDGTTQWEFVTGSADINPYEGRRPSPTIAPDGTIYFPANQPGKGVLFAIQGDSGPAESPWPMQRQNAQHTGRIPFAITNQPASQIVLAGTTVVFDVGVASTQPCLFQWRYNGTNMPNQTNATLALTTVAVGDSGGYTCLVSNRSGAFLSREASLLVLSGPLPADIVVDNPQATFSGEWLTGVSALGKYGSDYRFAYATSGVYTASATYTPSIPVAGNYDVYIWYPSGSNRSKNALWLVACGGDTQEVGINQQTSGGRWLQIAANKYFDAGTNGFVRVSNDTGESGGVVIADAVAFVPVMASNVPPFILQQPISQTVAAGTSAAFSITASGTGPLSYEWRHNNVGIFGATESIYTRTDAQPATAGDYSVIVSSPLGAVTSAVVVLTVTNTPPAVAALSANQVVGGCSEVMLRVSTIGSDPRIYQWQVNGVNIPGASAPNYVLNCVQPGDSGGYRVVVSNAFGVVTSAVTSVIVTNSAPWPFGVGRGLTGAYYAHHAKTFLDSPALIRVDPAVNFDWDTGSPDPSIYVDKFTVRWTGQIQPLYTETYTFTITSDDGVRLWVDGQLLIDTWSQYQSGGTNAPLHLSADRRSDFTLEYFEWEYGASAQLFWSSPSQPEQIIPQSQLYPDLGPVVLVDGQISPSDEHVVTNSALIEIQSEYPNATIIYSTDGSRPAFPSIYTGPFTIKRSAIVRATAYSADFSHSGDSRPTVVTVIPTYTLTATTLGGGTVQVDPVSTCYVSNAAVNLTATPDSGWAFLQWLGDLSGDNSAPSLTMNRNKSVQAVFGTTLHTTVAGSGSVLIDPLVSHYPYGSVVRLTGVPQPGNQFALWGNAGGGGVNPLHFSITNPTPAVSALFVPLTAGQHALAVIPDGFGRVEITPRANVYATGTSVSLNAIPEPGQSFLAWSGDAAGTQNPLTISMNSSKTIVATFTRKPTLSVDSSPEWITLEGCRLTLTGEFGAAYQIDVSTNLMEWAPLMTLTNAYGRSQFTDDSATNFAFRFYRASALTP